MNPKPKTSMSCPQADLVPTFLMFFFSISCPTFSIFFDFLANSPTKATSMESRTSKSSPQKTSSTSQPLHTISSSTHAALQPLLNMTSSTLTPSAYTSSSGKRKASNPQKFTRFREVSLLDSTDNLSPSHLPANMGASVGSALQFIPSVISSMMQQHMENEAQREVSWQGGFPVFVRVVFILSVSCSTQNFEFCTPLLTLLMMTDKSMLPKSLVLRIIVALLFIL